MNDTLKQSLAEVFSITPEALTSDQRLEDLDGWDSVAVLSMMVVLGEGLGREVEPEEVLQLKTFGDIERLAAA